MDENELDIKIKIAIQQGLFNKNNINNSKIFDCYGNYFFPTDYFISEDNTILSVTQASDFYLEKCK